MREVLNTKSKLARYTRSIFHKSEIYITLCSQWLGLLLIWSSLHMDLSHWQLEWSLSPMLTGPWSLIWQTYIFQKQKTYILKALDLEISKNFHYLALSTNIKRKNYCIQLYYMWPMAKTLISTRPNSKLFLGFQNICFLFHGNWVSQD